MNESVNISLFIATFFAVSLTPGMCMMLSMGLGIKLGHRKTLWMMLGELAGVALVAILSATGIASIFLLHKNLFIVLKIIGGCYIIYLGISMWLSKGRLSVSNDTEQFVTRPLSLISQGFITAIANPKGWAFFISLLPPFINYQEPITHQLIILVSIIITIEFLSLNLYCLGGKGLKKLLEKKGNVILINRIAGAMMVFVAILLFIS